MPEISAGYFPAVPQRRGYRQDLRLITMLIDNVGAGAAGEGVTDALENTCYVVGVAGESTTQPPTVAQVGLFAWQLTAFELAGGGPKVTSVQQAQVSTVFPPAANGPSAFPRAYRLRRGAQIRVAVVNNSVGAARLGITFWAVELVPTRDQDARARAVERKGGRGKRESR